MPFRRASEGAGVVLVQFAVRAKLHYTPALRGRGAWRQLKAHGNHAMGGISTQLRVQHGL